MAIRSRSPSRETASRSGSPRRKTARRSRSFSRERSENVSCVSSQASVRAALASVPPHDDVLPIVHDSELDALSKLMYAKYKHEDCLPVECLVNLCLLLRGNRKLIQFDRYLYDQREWDQITELLEYPLLRRHIFMRAQKRDILVFTDVKMDTDTTEELSHKYLDKEFYCSAYDNNRFKSLVTRVAIGVVGPVEQGDVAAGATKLKDLKVCKRRNYVGQLLLMECSEVDLERNVQQFYKCFCRYKAFIWQIDPLLQVTLEFYSKSGIWENQPFLKPCACAYTA